MWQFSPCTLHTMCALIDISCETLFLSLSHLPIFMASMVHVCFVLTFHCVCLPRNSLFLWFFRPFHTSYMRLCCSQYIPAMNGCMYFDVKWNVAPSMLMLSGGGEEKKKRKNTSTTNRNILSLFCNSAVVWARFIACASMSVLECASVIWQKKKSWYVSEENFSASYRCKWVNV